MGIPKIHLISPAGTCRSFFPQIEVDSAEQLIAIVQETVGSNYLLTANETLMEVVENESQGGRNDDRQRAEDIEQALADDEVVAIITIRGGAWFTRVLPLIDFSVMDRRTTPVSFFGFSELTPLANIIGAHEQGTGYYSMGPAFLPYGLKRHARLHMKNDLPPDMSVNTWVKQQLRPTFESFFRETLTLIENREKPKPFQATLVRGQLQSQSRATFVGGNLTVFSTLIGSRYQECISPAGNWIVLEDFNDKIERFDRFLSHLTLADYWHKCDGLLLGDFHEGFNILTEAILALLDYHIPTDSSLPILVTEEVGHVWPMAILPLHCPMNLRRHNDKDVTIQCV